VRLDLEARTDLQERIEFCVSRLSLPEQPSVLEERFLATSAIDDAVAGYNDIHNRFKPEGAFRLPTPRWRTVSGQVARD
jgi:hypothetical protein